MYDQKNLRRSLAWIIRAQDACVLLHYSYTQKKFEVSTTKFLDEFTQIISQSNVDKIERSNLLKRKHNRVIPELKSESGFTMYKTWNEFLNHLYATLALFNCREFLCLYLEQKIDTICLRKIHIASSENRMN